MQENNIIVLEQLPIIKTHLEQLSLEIKKRVDDAKNLICTEETVKDVKQVRANLTKEFNELEAQRKQVKNAIMDKYNQFEEIYKENVSNLYKQADSELKEKIENVEIQLKKEKEEELREFADNWFDYHVIKDIVKFEDIGLNITLSASMKSLKDQTIAFCEKISNDIKLIELEEYKDEIMIEYKKNLDFAQSKIDVTFRHKQLEAMQKRNEEILKMKLEEQKVVEKVEEVVEEIKAPVEIETTTIEDKEEQFVATFTVKASKDKLKLLREFMKKEGIIYE